MDKKGVNNRGRTQRIVNDLLDDSKRWGRKRYDL